MKQVFRFIFSKQIVTVSLISFAASAISLQAIARDKQPRRFDTDLPVVNSTTSNQPQQNLSVEERLARLERILDSQGLVDLVLQIQSLQKEIQQLRDDVETQGHTLSSLNKRQRDLYIDLDRRMLQLERGGRAAAPSQPATASSPSPIVAPATSQVPTQVPSTSQTVKPAPVVTAPKPSIDPIKEQNAYQKAFDLLRELRYDAAIAEFRKFIQAYPNGRYAHIAQYWLSEASYAQRHFKQAIVDYQKLLDNYPNSPKLAEAMLKIGYCYYELNDLTRARTHLEKLIRVYPGTTAASQGQNLLKTIKIKQSKK